MKPKAFALLAASCLLSTVFSLPVKPGEQPGNAPPPQCPTQPGPRNRAEIDRNKDASWLYFDINPACRFTASPEPPPPPFPPSPPANPDGPPAESNRILKRGGMGQALSALWKTVGPYVRGISKTSFRFVRDFRKYGSLKNLPGVTFVNDGPLSRFGSKNLVSFTVPEGRGVLHKEGNGRLVLYLLGQRGWEKPIELIKPLSEIPSRRQNLIIWDGRHQEYWLRTTDSPRWRRVTIAEDE